MNTDKREEGNERNVSGLPDRTSVGQWFKIISNEEKETNEHIRTGRNPQGPYPDGLGNPDLLPVKSIIPRTTNPSGWAA